MRLFEAFGEDAALHESGFHFAIMSRHDREVRFGGVKLVQGFQFAEDGVAVFFQKELSDEAGAFALDLDVAEVPGDVADEQNFGAILLVDIDDLAAGRMTWGLDENDAGSDGKVLVVNNGLELAKDILGDDDRRGALRVIDLFLRHIDG